MIKESEFVKIRTAVPVKYADVMRNALGDAEAGVQGNYAFCSGSYRQIGRFQPLKGANPAIGSIGELEEVEEEVIETICHKDLLPNVVKAIKKVHPYEEPPIDIIARLEVE